jgi:antitoxin component YwqK of YwqJK toxin-antitoxin module
MVEMPCGEKDGIEHGWFQSGQKSYNFTWKNGKLDGFSIGYFETGELSSFEHYQNGYLDGISIMFFKTGDPKIQLEFKNGKLHGQTLSYYSPGNLRRKGQYNNGVGTTWEYYKAGGIKQIFVWENEDFLKSKEFYDPTGYMYYKAVKTDGVWKIIKHDKSKEIYLTEPPFED